MDRIVIPTLETERLRLRAFRRSDFEDYAALRADPEVMRHLDGGELWERGRAWRHLAFLIGHWQLGEAGTWALEEKITGTLAGVVGFSTPEAWPRFELAWALARRFWGRGYATEGATAALAYAFDVLHKDEVVSFILPENRRSIGVAERLGQCLSGTFSLPRGEFLVYGISRITHARRRNATAPFLFPDLRRTA